MANAEHRINANGGYTIELVRERGVFSGHKHFHITEAPTIGETYTATGLPADGDPFDALHPNCKARRFTPYLLPGSFGMWRMRVDYGEDIGEDVTPAEGLELTTTLEQSRSSVNVDLDWTGTKKLTNNEVGIPKLVNVLALQVIQYSTSLPNIAPLMALSDSPKVNESAITLKRFMGVNEATLDFGAKQLLYAGFALSREGGYFVIRHELQARRTWENERQLVDSSGKPTGDTEISDAYEPVDFLAYFGQA